MKPENIGIPLSNKELFNFLRIYEGATAEKGINYILFYDDLQHVQHIDNVFGESNFRVLFISSDKSEVGHWTLLLRRTNNSYEYFDSFGFGPDGLNKDLNDNPERQNAKHLSELLKRSPNTELIYTKYRLQDLKNDTCAKWIIARVLALGIQQDEFCKLYMKAAKANKLTTDEYLMKILFVPLVD